jgi:hypothetical protein
MIKEQKESDRKKATERRLLYANPTIPDLQATLAG